MSGAALLMRLCNIGGGVVSVLAFGVFQDFLLDGFRLAWLLIFGFGSWL